MADYLIQAQGPLANVPAGCAELRSLDTRGNGSAVASMGVLFRALWRIVVGRISRRLVGVHVNMAERLSVFRKAVIIVVCRLMRIPVVLHLHAAQLPQFYQKLPYGMRWVVRWVFSLPAQCIVLGEAARDFVVKELRVRPEKVTIVRNGVPGPVLPRRIPDTADLKEVLFLGNLSERKGVSDFLRALAAAGFDAKRLHVSLAGGGNLPYYQNMARQLGVDELVDFAGWVNQPASARLLAKADILVLPSYDEGLPLVILEALAYGVAVICSPVGEIPNVLTDGIDACFVQPGDVQGIARCLESVLYQPHLREQLERNGHATYMREFSVSRFFDNIATIHRQCFGVCASREGLSVKKERFNTTGSAMDRI